MSHITISVGDLANMNLCICSLRMATIGLANLHYKKRNHKEAVKCLQKYVEDCQDDIVYCTALAHCLFMAKNYTESSFIYHTIIEFYKSTSFTLISVSPISRPGSLDPT